MSHMLRFLTCRANYQHLYHRGRVTHLCVGLSGSSKPVFSQIMAYRLIDAKLLSETMLTYCWLGPCEQILVKCYIKIQQFSYEEIHLENLSAKWRPFWSSLNVIPWTITQDVTYAAMLTHWGRDIDGRYFADDVFKCIFLNENVWTSFKISLKLLPKGPINNIPLLVQIMAWPRPGDKPLSEPMMVRLLTHICVTRPQWVNRAEKTSTDSAWSENEVIIYVSMAIPN